MADPIIVLNSLQQAIDDGMHIDLNELEASYKFFYDEPGHGRRFSFAKIINSEAQALAIFGLVTKIENIICFNVGYAVKDSCRGQGLAIEAVNHGLEQLKKQLKYEGLTKFYLEAVIDKNNIHSINVAKKLFADKPIPVIDGESGTHSIQFKKLIII